ncbi:putative Noc1p protein [Thermoascus aurantiacus ATCC 26904]
MAPVDDIQVGDLVNVPGGMYGTVRYLGPVAGKPGRFAGIELAPEHASRGKNSGDVDGRRYFSTAIPGSGIFVPINNNRYVTKRAVANPTTPARPAAVNFSKSVGPSPSVPKSSLRRPPLQRPESPRSAPPSKPTFTGLRTPSAMSRTHPPPNGFSRPQARTPSRPVDRPPSSVSMNMDDETPPPSLRISDPHPASAAAVGAEVMELREKVRNLEQQLRDRDRQLEEQAVTLADLQQAITELEGEDALSVRQQLREKNEKIAQLTAEFDSHRADFRSTLDTLEIAASETERVYERKIDELMQQNRELRDRDQDVEAVARQLKQLEELVSELEEGLEDARRGEAEARAEVEFLRGEVERTKLELKQERERSAAARKEAGASADGQRHAKELDQKDDEIRGLKAIIHSLSRGEANPALLRQNGISAEQDPQDAERISRLEQRVEELEGILERKDYRIEELERELEQLQLSGSGRGGRTRSSTVTMSSPAKQRKSSVSGSGGNTVNHAHRLSDRTVVPGDWQEDRHDSSDESRHHLETMHESDNHSSDEGTAPWCEICEVSGHDILTCTSMFGNRNGAAKTNANGKANNNDGTGHGASHDEEPAVGGPVNRPASPAVSSTAPRSFGGSPASQRTGRDAALDGLKGIGGMSSSSSMTPVAGKSSGVIDESKWCALCERDGHESIDCPFED